MKVTLDFGYKTCTVLKEEGDPRFHNTDWASAESTFLYHVKKELEKQGYDVIKKRMWKDGHLVDDTQQYIRTRKDGFYIYNDYHAICDAGEEFNETGNVNLALVE